MRISDWSSDVCSSDLELGALVMLHESALVDRAAILISGFCGDEAGKVCEICERLVHVSLHGMLMSHILGCDLTQGMRRSGRSGTLTGTTAACLTRVRAASAGGGGADLVGVAGPRVGAGAASELGVRLTL